MASLLKKFVDAEQWDAEDIAGRLGMVLHAAFLFAGFQPYGAQPRSGHLLKKQSRKGSLCLSRQYTAPDLAHRDGADAAVVMLCAQGSEVALLVFLTTATTDGDDVPDNAYMERLDLEIVRPLLSGSLEGVEPRASRICKSLADGVCWGFLDELCRRNGLPLSGFESLPDDLKIAILDKLTDCMDLARVECVSSQLRLLVGARARRRGRWHLCSWFCRSTYSPYKEHVTLNNLRSSWSWIWKDRRVEVRRISYLKLIWWCFDTFDFEPIQMMRRRNLSPWPFFIVSKDGKTMCRICIKRRKSSWPPEYWLSQHLPPAAAEETVSMRIGRSGGHRRKLARNDCKKKWNGGGAIHSPSSHYRWKHR